MNLHTLEAFLAVVREGTVSGAATVLHLSQPSLSRQMKELEEDLGVRLFLRGNRRITLTEEGMILRKRAEEMLTLIQMTEDEIAQARNHISGTIRIGAGESRSFHFLSRTVKKLRDEWPGLRFHITSGDTKDLLDELDRGLIDFAVVFSEYDHTVYQSVSLPAEDRFGILLRRDHPLASVKELSLDSLQDIPLIISRALEPSIGSFPGSEGLNIIGTYNLLYNASLLVEDGVCCALCFDNLINTTGDSPLCCVPLTPGIPASGALIWKKYQIIAPAVQLFIDQVREELNKDL